MASTIGSFLLSTLGKVGLSLVGTIATFCVGRFWLGVLKPFIQSLSWQGRKLDATYKGEFLQIGTGQVVNDHIELKQNATRVWGTMTVAASNEGKYKFEATLDELILRGTFQGVESPSTSRGSFLLVAQPGSREFKGWCIEPSQGNAIAYEYKWSSRNH